MPGNYLPSPVITPWCVLFPSRSQQRDSRAAFEAGWRGPAARGQPANVLPAEPRSLTEPGNVLQPWAMACPADMPLLRTAEHAQCWSHFLINTSLRHAGLLLRSAVLMWSLLTSCGLSLLWILSFLNMICISAWLMIASLVLFTPIPVLLCCVLCLMHEAEKQRQMTVQQQHFGAQPRSVKFAFRYISRGDGGLRTGYPACSSEKNSFLTHQV